MRVSTIYLPIERWWVTVTFSLSFEKFPNSLHCAWRSIDEGDHVGFVSQPRRKSGKDSLVEVRGTGEHPDSQERGRD